MRMMADPTWVIVCLTSHVLGVPVVRVEAARAVQLAELTELTELTESTVAVVAAVAVSAAAVSRVSVFLCNGSSSYRRPRGLTP